KVAFVAQANQTYFILITGFSTTGTFTLNVTGNPTPANDLCSTPTVITGGSGSIAGTNAGATGDASTLTSPGLASCAASYTLFDTWYSSTRPCSGTVSIGTCGAFDTVVSVYSSCPTPTLANQIAGACNDNGAAGCTPGSQVTFSATAATTYLIRVATAGAATPNAGGGLPFTLTWSLPDGDLDGVADCLDNCP